MGFSHPSKEMCAWAKAQENDIQLLDPSLGPKLEAVKEGAIHKRGRWEDAMAMQPGSHAEHQNQQVEASTIGISCSEQKQHFE